MVHSCLLVVVSSYFSGNGMFLSPGNGKFITSGSNTFLASDMFCDHRGSWYETLNRASACSVRALSPSGFSV